MTVGNQVDAETVELDIIEAEAQAALSALKVRASIKLLNDTGPENLVEFMDLVQSSSRQLFAHLTNSFMTPEVLRAAGPGEFSKLNEYAYSFSVKLGMFFTQLGCVFAANGSGALLYRVWKYPRGLAVSEESATH